jgi:MOSC domain-containing protein YiiM
MQASALREDPSELFLQVVDFEIRHLFISAGHNYFGQHGKPPGGHPIIEVERIQCVTSKGIAGDRFFGFKKQYKGQITFFEEEVYQDLCLQFGVWDRNPEAFRRNVITRGVRLNELIGREFELQGVRFLGREECRPCYWMDLAFATGTEVALQGRGGLRAEILSDGFLTRAGKQASSQQPSSQ